MRAENKESVEKGLLHAFGVFGWAHAAPLFVSPVKGTPGRMLVLSVERGSVDSVRAACELASPPISVERVSGTLKGLLGKRK